MIQASQFATLTRSTPFLVDRTSESGHTSIMVIESNRAALSAPGGFEGLGYPGLRSLGSDLQPGLVYFGPSALQSQPLRGQILIAWPSICFYLLLASRYFF
jgi:hypothetical protein